LERSRFAFPREGATVAVTLQNAMSDEKEAARAFGLILESLK